MSPKDCTKCLVLPAGVTYFTDGDTVYRLRHNIVSSTEDEVLVVPVCSIDKKEQVLGDVVLMKRSNVEDMYYHPDSPGLLPDCG